MMKRKTHRHRFSVRGAVLALSAGLLLSPTAAQAQMIRETADVGDYSITLKVMLPSSNLFDGPNALAVCDGVAQPNSVSGCIYCQVLALIEKNGKTVDHARVNISYRRLSPRAGPWTELLVKRMWIAPHAQIPAETALTTHFGNQVELLAGRYEARVTVDGHGPAAFRFSLHR